MQKVWRFHPQRPDVRDLLSRSLRISPVLAQLLANRGIVEPAQAQEFIRPSLDSLSDPALLPDMEKAVERIGRAIRDREPVVVHGDYDVDGVTGTALLLNFFKVAGHEASFHIPNRVEDGYGLSMGTMEKLRDAGTRVLVTVDCGTSSVEEIAFARANGIDVIVTDHHEPPERLPEALAVINPKLPGSRYPNRDICGSAVAFKLAWALAQGLSNGRKVGERFRRFLTDALGFVALGTIADVVPLVGENRVFAAYGLEALRHSEAPGVTSLLRRACGDKPLSSRDVAFKIAPRLNAGGRVGSATLGVELLTEADPARADEIVGRLEAANRERRKIEDQIVEEACALIEEQGYHRRRVIVVGKQGWHGGVIGIVAAKLVDMYSRPAIVFSLMDGKTRGSARSCGDFSMYDALRACEGLFVSFGGHSMAAGMTMPSENLDELREKVNEYAERALRGEEPEERVSVDAELALSSIGEGFMQELRLLEPHGAGNPAPVFASTQLRMARPPNQMGKKGEHLNVSVLQGDVSLRAVGWGMGERVPELVGVKGPCEAAYTVEWNEWQGRRTIELRLQDIRSTLAQAPPMR